MVFAVSFLKPLFMLALPLRAATIPQAPTLAVAISHAAVIRGRADLSAENIHPKMEVLLTESREQDANSTRPKKGLIAY
jgi:hypothetical protein